MREPKKRNSPTIRDVARHAGVSPMSVSNFLNGRLHLMRDDTRARIEVAIKHLGYRPSSQARGFRQGKDYTVGMIVVDPSPNFLVEPFIGHVVTGLSTELSAQGYACLLQGVRNSRLDDATLHTFARSDALCLFPSGPAPQRRRLIAKLASFGIPLVLIEDTVPSDIEDIVCVRQDDAGGAKMLMRHLLDLGARRFLYAAPEPVWPANVARETMFRRMVRKLGSKASFARLDCGFGNFAEVQEALERWLDAGGRCDAILANNDHIGIAVLKALDARGIAVPDDMMVTGFGAFELWNYSSPLLTTVASPAHALGQCAARALLDRLARGSFAQREWVLPMSFRSGETTRQHERQPGSRTAQQ
jgi:LacI family transcriptional regulator